jgi:hypothetical protein
VFDAFFGNVHSDDGLALSFEKLGPPPESGRDLENRGRWDEAMDSRIEDEVPQCFRTAETSRPLVAPARPGIRVIPDSYILFDSSHVLPLRERS